MRKQEPKEENWLYRDLTESERVFTKIVYLGINDTEWEECTDAEKEQWEEEHPLPEPESEPEPNTQEQYEHQQQDDEQSGGISEK